MCEVRAVWLSRNTTASSHSSPFSSSPRAEPSHPLNSLLSQHCTVKGGLVIYYLWRRRLEWASNASLVVGVASFDTNIGRHCTALWKKYVCRQSDKTCMPIIMLRSTVLETWLSDLPASASKSRVPLSLAVACKLGEFDERYLKEGIKSYYKTIVSTDSTTYQLFGVFAIEQTTCEFEHWYIGGSGVQGLLPYLISNFHTKHWPPVSVRTPLTSLYGL